MMMMMMTTTMMMLMMMILAYICYSYYTKHYLFGFYHASY